MKLYTEEEVKKAISIAEYQDYEYEQIIDELTPIEIPSDDIIKEAANGNIDGYNGAMWLKYNYIIKNKS
jgi:hypothetical protein